MGDASDGVLMTVIFTRLTDRYSQEKVYYIIISGFIIGFAFFAFLCIPLANTSILMLSRISWKQNYRLGFKGLISMFRYWDVYRFYVCPNLGYYRLNARFFSGALPMRSPKSAKPSVFTVYSRGSSNLATIIAGQAAIYISQPILIPIYLLEKAGGSRQ